MLDSASLPAFRTGSRASSLLQPAAETNRRNAASRRGAWHAHLLTTSTLLERGLPAKLRPRYRLKHREAKAQVVPEASGQLIHLPTDTTPSRDKPRSYAYAYAYAFSSSKSLKRRRFLQKPAGAGSFAIKVVHPTPLALSGHAPSRMNPLPQVLFFCSNNNGSSLSPIPISCSTHQLPAALDLSDVVLVLLSASLP
jgi:hypothetical protein